MARGAPSLTDTWVYDTDGVAARRRCRHCRAARCRVVGSFWLAHRRERARRQSERVEPHEATTPPRPRPRCRSSDLVYRARSSSTRSRSRRPSCARRRHLQYHPELFIGGQRHAFCVSASLLQPTAHLSSTRSAPSLHGRATGGPCGRSSCSRARGFAACLSVCLCLSVEFGGAS